MDSPLAKRMMLAVMIVGLAFSILCGLSSSRTLEPKTSPAATVVAK
jgi:hypothetical protein